MNALLMCVSHCCTTQGTAFVDSVIMPSSVLILGGEMIYQAKSINAGLALTSDNLVPWKEHPQHFDMQEHEQKMVTLSFRRSSNSWLSTGWFTMAIALELCDRTNVFGMVPPEFCRYHHIVF